MEEMHLLTDWSATAASRHGCLGFSQGFGYVDVQGFVVEDFLPELYAGVWSNGDCGEVRFEAVSAVQIAGETLVTGAYTPRLLFVTQQKPLICQRKPTLISTVALIKNRYLETLELLQLDKT